MSRPRFPHLVQARRAEAAFPRDDHKTFAVLPHDDRLHHAVPRDAVRKFFELFLIKRFARLIRVGINQINIRVQPHLTT